jgi:hypothetical protein
MVELIKSGYRASMCKEDTANYPSHPSRLKVSTDRVNRH